MNINKIFRNIFQNNFHRFSISWLSLRSPSLTGTSVLKNATRDFLPTTPAAGWNTAARYSCTARETSRLRDGAIERSRWRDEGGRKREIKSAHGGEIGEGRSGYVEPAARETGVRVGKGWVQALVERRSELQLADEHFPRPLRVSTAYEQHRAGKQRSTSQGQLKLSMALGP